METTLKKILTPFITFRVGGIPKDQLIAETSSHVSTDVYGAGRDLLKDVRVSQTVETIALVELSIADLGFTDHHRPRTNEFMSEHFCNRWSAENLERQRIALCQSEDSLHLAKEWRGGTEGIFAYLAMKLVQISWQSNWAIWSVSCHSSGERNLQGFITYDRSPFWSPGNKIVFRLLDV